MTNLVLHQKYTSLGVLFFLTLCLAVFFRVFSEIDSNVTRFLYELYQSQGAWYQALLQWVRRINFFLLYGTIFAVATCVLYKLFYKKRATNVFFQKILYVVLSFCFSSAIVSDLLIKTFFQRSRPIKVLRETEVFTPAFVIGKSCVKNCSFISSEVAFATAFFALLVFVPSRHRFVVSVGIFLWVLVMCFVRMAQIGHYLSDVVFAVLFTLLILEAFRLLLVPKPVFYR